MRLALIWIGLIALFSVTALQGGVYASNLNDGVPELVIYTYDSFLAQGGLGSLIFTAFEKKHSCRIKVLGSGDGGQILTRLQLDSQRGKPSAHLIVGIDQIQWERVKPWVESWEGWSPLGYQELLPQTRVAEGFLAYDYGPLGLMADMTLLKKLGLTVPHSLHDLVKPEFKRKLILEDPRSSTPGLVFFLYAQKILGDSVWNFFTQLSGQWLALAPGWDDGYGLFLKEEAPLVWSYITSQAYHLESPAAKTSRENNRDRFKAILFKEGQPYQVEGAALVKGSIRSEIQKKLARLFLEYLISPEVQRLVPTTNWMYPSRAHTPLPASFKSLPKIDRLISIQPDAEESQDFLTQWRRTVSR